MRCKKQDINAIFKWCEQYADDDIKRLIGTQPSIYEIAYHVPSNANWAYIMGLVTVGGNTYEVVTRFGEVLAAMPAYVPAYTASDLEKRRI